MTTVFVAFGIVYGLMVSMFILLFADMYIGNFFNFELNHSVGFTALISILFFGVVAQKSYATLIYSLDAGRSMSLMILVAVGITITACASLLPLLNPKEMLVAYSLMIGVGLTTVVIIDAWRRLQRLSPEFGAL